MTPPPTSHEYLDCHAAIAIACRLAGSPSPACPCLQRHFFVNLKAKPVSLNLRSYRGCMVNQERSNGGAGVHGEQGCSWGGWTECVDHRFAPSRPYTEIFCNGSLVDAEWFPHAFKHAIAWMNRWYVLLTFHAVRGISHERFCSR